MSTGCKKCDKKQAETGDKTALCDRCELSMLEATAEVAVRDYVDKVNEIIAKGVENGNIKD